MSSIEDQSSIEDEGTLDTRGIKSLIKRQSIKKVSSKGLIETFEIRNYTVYKLKQYQFSIQLYTVAIHSYS